jgi:trimeric autotransporter adhesin
MKTIKKGFKRLKIPLLILSMGILFSFGFNTVTATDTSQIHQTPSVDSSLNPHIATNTHSFNTDSNITSSLTELKSQTNSIKSSNSLSSKNIQSLPDPQIYRNGVAVARGKHNAGYSYSTIAAAITDSKDGDTIMLENGKTFYEHGFIITKNLDFKVFNNGYITIDGQNRGGIFTINPGIHVNLQNIKFINGKSTNGAAILNYGILIITGCSFKNNYATITGGANNGGAIYNKPDGFINVDDSSFTSNHAKSNGGAIFNYGHLSVRGCVFSDNTASKDGGAIYNNMINHLFVTDSTFNYNTALYGGAIYNSKEGPLDVNGCSFNGNKAGLDGGAIHNFDGGSLTVKSSNFTSNSAYGGAAIHNTSNLIVSICTFTGNHATYGAAIDNVDTVKQYIFQINNSKFSNNTATDGGAIFNYIAGTLTITGSNFTSNSATRDGGAIVTGGTLTVTGSTFSNNKAVYGGAIYNNNGVTLTVKSSNFISNRASNIGGAIYKCNGNLGVYDCNFTSNNAVNGGAIYKKYGALTVRNNTFTSNNATNNGGAIYKDGGSLIVTGNTFTKNTATNYGGAIYTKNASTYVTSNNFVGNRAVKGVDMFKA